MSQIKELLIEELQDLLHAEKQLVAAIPKMVEAANDPKLKENFATHLSQTKVHVERLELIFQMLGEEPQTKPCKAMMGLIEEGEEVIEEGKEKDPLIADLALIMAGQKVEHYEICAYGTLKVLARQIGEYEVSKLLCLTLGEEESTDAILTMNAKPLLQEATVQDLAEEADEMEEDDEEEESKEQNAHRL
jgi:Mn-containing catalase